jgi:hypothetical protein
LPQLFGELKRRNVFRVAVTYIMTSWLILQVADVVIGIVEKMYGSAEAVIEEISLLGSWGSGLGLEPYRPLLRGT